MFSLLMASTVDAEHHGHASLDTDYISGRDIVATAVAAGQFDTLAAALGAPFFWNESNDHLL